jgi:hypothetical protein
MLEQYMQQSESTKGPGGALIRLSSCEPTINMPPSQTHEGEDTKRLKNNDTNLTNGEKISNMDLMAQLNAKF